MAWKIPARLAVTCGTTAARALWLERLPEAIGKLERRWRLTTGAPFEEGSCSWVAPAALAGGGSAILKIGMPHMEAEHEAQGLRFWDGDPTVRLLAADEEVGGMLLERCEPGTLLTKLPETEQDAVIAGLLRRLWRHPPAGHPFRLYRR